MVWPEFKHLEHSITISFSGDAIADYDVRKLFFTIATENRGQLTTNRTVSQTANLKWDGFPKSFESNLVDRHVRTHEVQAADY